MMNALLAACLFLPLATADSQAGTPTLQRERRVVVVHAETGKPLAGAEVLAVAEIQTPTWGDTWWTHRVFTDEAGQATIPRPTDEAPYGWLFVRSEGFGARAAGDSTIFSAAGTEDVRVELMPETPVQIELLDFTGAPLPLAHLGIALGCGHTPDLLSTTTGPKGRATLRGFHEYDGGIMDLFIVHPEVGRSTYSHLPTEDAVDGVVRVYAPSDGRLLRGQVLLPDLTPARGYAVGTRANHRGPWAVTDAEGRFQLFGWDPDQSSFNVYDPNGDLLAGFSGAREGMERILVLDGTTSPERNVDGEEDTPLPRGGIWFEITVTGEGLEELREWDRAIPVEAWDPVTGQSFTGEAVVNKDPLARVHHAKLHLPAGEYLLEVGRPDSPYAPVSLGSVAVDAYVPKGLGDPNFTYEVVKATVPAPRLVTIKVPPHTPDFTFYVHHRGHSESFEPGDGPGQKGVTRRESGALEIEHFAVPHGRLGFSLERSLDHVWERIDLEVEPATRATADWVLRPRLR